jgi:RNA polymerase sigma-70 factor (ECF subfamily)
LPWLLAVANNCLRNLRRSQRRHRNFLSKLPPSTLGDFADDVASRLDDERRMAQVLLALSVLREQDQEVIALCD